MEKINLLSEHVFYLKNMPKINVVQNEYRFSHFARNDYLWCMEEFLLSPDTSQPSQTHKSFLLLEAFQLPTA